MIEDNKVMLNHAVDFYKNLFGQEVNNGMRLGEDF